MNIQKSYFKLLLNLIGFFICVINGCRKPEVNPDDGEICQCMAFNNRPIKKWIL